MKTILLRLTDRTLVIGEWNERLENPWPTGDTLKLEYALTLHPMQDGNCGVGALFSDKEEYAIINTTNILYELPVVDAIEALYTEYKNKVFFNGLIVPQEKKIIL